MVELFDPTPGPRVFATPLGVDFCATLIAGLDQMLAGQPPEARARVEIWVANARMQRRLQTLYMQQSPGFLPQIRPVLSLADEADVFDVTPAISPLRLRLILADLTAQLMERVPDLAPRAALYDIADGLADLMGELYEEDVAPDALARIDVATHADHWKRAKELLGLITSFVQDDGKMTSEARQALVVERLAARWSAAPPDTPILVAGSTGSRGATARFMAAVSRLPQGAVILPGIDRDMPKSVWHDLLQDRRAGLAGEDHPQFRLAKFAADVGLAPHLIPNWPGAEPQQHARTAAVSLALRPAPVTDQWRVEGPNLTGLEHAFDGVTLVEAESPQMEAAAIALRLREAVEAGEKAALISPDPSLTRQVTAALDRWSIRPDDSAGTKLSFTAPGRFFRHVVALETGPATAEDMVILLKHPLCHTGADRGAHLKRTRELELQVLRRLSGPPTRAALVTWAERDKAEPGDMAWVAWIADTMLGPGHRARLPLADRVARHRRLAERLAAGPEDDGSGELYDKEPGIAVLCLLDDLAREAEAGGEMSARDYADFFDGLIADREVREPIFPHADILIWGTQEARVQGADLVILSGLNEGTWPAAPQADPWLNRSMRAEVGLRLPDRSVGLAAHDFQQAIAAPQVWLTRARRDSETDTVASRWLNRLSNLLQGSGDTARGALEAMRARGDGYLGWAATLMSPVASIDPEPRPAPVPPASARPTELSVTQVEKLIRDPYAIYAHRVLRLKKLDGLRVEPDARLRGTVMHRVMEQFIEHTQEVLPDQESATAILLTLADEVLAQDAPWPITQRLWRARFRRIAAPFWRNEAARRQIGQPGRLEVSGEWQVPGTGVLIKGKADRFDRLRDGTLAIYDYKSGKPPTEKEERAFNQQLWIEALMAEAGSFDLPRETRVGRIAYIGLASGEEVIHEIDPAALIEMAARFRDRLVHMRDAQSAFPSRRSVRELRFSGDYDHLARHGEWDDTQEAERVLVGQTDG